jgi:hypothetical protein
MARNPSSDGMTPLSEGYPVLKRQPYFVVRRHAWRLETSHVDRGGTDGAPRGASALCPADDLSGLPAEGTIQVASQEAALDLADAAVAVAFDLLQGEVAVAIGLVELSGHLAAEARSGSGRSAIYRAKQPAAECVRRELQCI